MIAGLFPLIRPLAAMLDAERAHDLALRALARLPVPAATADDPRLAVDLFGLTFTNPIGLAAGFDKNARVADPLFRLGFGAVEVGGVTPLPQSGNPRPRVFRLAQDGAVINRYGLNSEGAESVAPRLARAGLGGILGVNLGANKESADRLADYAALVARLGRLADYVTINISSPNTAGLRDLQARARLDELLARSCDVRTNNRRGVPLPILVKIAPDIALTTLDDIIAVCLHRRCDGLVIANTTVSRPGTLRRRALAGETGGLSGRPLFGRSTWLLAEAALRLEGAIPLVGVGGVEDGASALAKFEAGAKLVQLYTALIYQGPMLIGAIKKHLLAAIGTGDLGALVGRRARDIAKAGPGED